MKELKTAITKLSREELERANARFPLFRSDHEGLGVIAEEVWESEREFELILDRYDALKFRIFNDLDLETTEIVIDLMKFYAINACAELVQVIAMCDKFIDSRNKRDE